MCNGNVVSHTAVVHKAEGLLPSSQHLSTFTKRTCGRDSIPVGVSPSIFGSRDTGLTAAMPHEYDALRCRRDG